jgi:hypothetical protein
MSSCTTKLARSDVFTAHGTHLPPSAYPFTIMSVFKRGINATERTYHATENFLAPPDPLTTPEGLTARNSLRAGDPVCTCPNLDADTRAAHVQEKVACRDVASSCAVETFLDTAWAGWTYLKGKDEKNGLTGGTTLNKSAPEGEGWYGPFQVTHMDPNPYLRLLLNSGRQTDPSTRPPEPVRELGLHWQMPYFPYVQCTCSDALKARGDHEVHASHDPRLADGSAACPLTFNRYDIPRVADYHASLDDDGNLLMKRKESLTVSERMQGGVSAEERTQAESDAAFAAFLGAGAAPNEMLLSAEGTVKGKAEASMWIRP